MLRLCSTSLSRQQILKENEITFIQCDNGFDEETLELSSPRSFVYTAAVCKYKKALETYGLELPLLVVDSVIECANTLQRKPKNQKEAKEFLQMQSGSSIHILSCCILHSNKFYFINLGKTTYEFSSFDLDDLEVYLQSQQWQNKAGAVMVEGFHKKYIKKQIGSTSNAMGLHFEAIQPFLELL
ncbi:MULTISPECIES: septum formation inhibitor Maf [Helicobacter]|uniref:Septum formation inhibitor Maf n=1 Tax=Helicobacter colisuis TaxID=2949739 RepID=A0ABT0TUB4_9HELI|nr:MULTISPECIES: septum formation inhibitor Maf [unclassified Helicobacter]MCI7765355.1 septum formation inhibitor Maf [Helicobacter sp.]MCL9819255.1 septum formation inhibitor Maf [Helicobacter colisuis]MCL9821745.1 septum formation inhibitor Maf [Helicobacter colisuis]RAX51976.1 septum formation inhibitor Maf [Helicobacter sp. 11-8110]